MTRISPATADDIPQLLTLINRAYRGEVSRQGWTTEADFLMGDLRTDADDLFALMQREHAVILKANTESGALTGCVFLEKRAGRLYLGMLSVDPALQAAGLGKQLLGAAEDHARNTGCRSVYFRVLSKRYQLIAWYERRGYALTGDTEPFDAPMKFGEPTEPLVFAIMEKPV
ncbi:MAG: GNAT family N-acetyltransferase [Saprospiraceae bacterium]|nr:GNAT family N-acetyltransferase [Saprospiraceae bacterium]MCB0542957.1 GNAT family N-acetyltransferase [Saprospiraceae bacterium]MCB0575569.1 GNAT family N-acetyltransferase [Saprospiraceae bacterium]